MKNIFLLFICLMATNTSLADTDIANESKVFNLFVGANIGAATAFEWNDFYYDKNISYETEERGMPFGWEINTGIKFLGTKYKYHPVLRIFYKQFYNSADVLGTQYISSNKEINTEYDADVKRIAYGVAFDHYIRVGHNDTIATYKGTVDTFLILGLSTGTAKKEYQFNSTQFADESSFIGLNFGVLFELGNGVGASIGTEYTSVWDTWSLNIGARYTF